MFGISRFLFESAKKSLVVILTDPEGGIWKIFNDGEGGPVIITACEELFDKIVDILS